MPADFRLPYWFQFGEILGRGAYGLVVRATDLRIKDHQKNGVAIKLIPRGEKITKYVEREVLLHRSLWHKHIVGFREACVSPTHLCIVLNYVAGGSVHRFVKSNGCLPEALARWLFQQLITAVDYCHRVGVTNRDIKLEHLLIDDPKQAYPIILLCDFGFAKQLNRHSEPKTIVGTPYYIAPEIMQSERSGQKYDGSKADIWSSGVCLFFMLYGLKQELRFRPKSSIADKAGPRKGEVEVMFPQCREHTDGPLDDISPDGKDFLCRMLQTNAQLRIKTEEIWDHPWFQKDLPPSAREYNAGLLNDQRFLTRFDSLQSESDLMEIVEAAQKTSPTPVTGPQNPSLGYQPLSS